MTVKYDLPICASGTLPAIDLKSMLTAVGFICDDSEWIESEIQSTTPPSTYTHFKVTLEDRDSRSILTIDTFLIKDWVHSETGETGQSPHGSASEYVRDEHGDWQWSGCLEYGG